MAKSSTRRATIYLENDLHRALRLKAVEVEEPLSKLVNDAIRQSLNEDAEDLEAFESRAHEKSIPFEEALKKLRARGKI